MNNLSPIGLQVPSPLLTDQRLRQRGSEAVIAQAGIRHEGLNSFLRAHLGGTDIARGALIAEPVFEAAGTYKTTDKTPANLRGTMLHPRLADALQGEDGDEEYRFNYPIYEHQLEAWNHLQAEQVRSVLVSSGTGSGKTECFLVPMLDDLAREVDQQGRLEGVRALMLYPLNALIASQEERLRRWIRPFGGDIRFALYNGLMTDKRQSARDLSEDKVPEQVLYRSTLRASPPPVLVTNITMLEYMTIRREDAPILKASQGKLRWVVIDEAHSYVGSAAAEIALLLRRVMIAFGVEPSTVRFVATSATIGGSDGESREALRRYLADLAGVPPANVNVVFGGRESVSLPQVANGSDLATNPAVQEAVRALEKEPLPLSYLERLASRAGTDAASLLEAITRKRLRPNGSGMAPLLPLRAHAFMRAIPGLWSCINPVCSGDRPRDWPFGSVLFELHETCPACRAPVFELLSCQDCGEPWLLAEEHGDHLRQASQSADADEFAAVTAREEGDETEDEAPTESASSAQILIGTRKLPALNGHDIDPLTGALSDRRGTGFTIWRTKPSASADECPHCRRKPAATGAGPLWPFRFGAPFLMQNATPIMIDGVSAKNGPHRLPADGRQLLSFTDSRQGTARFAANIETNAERAFVRAFVYHMVQKPAATAISLAERQSIEAERAQITAAGLPAELKQTLLAERDARLAVPATEIAWPVAVQALAREPELTTSIKEVWNADRDPRFEGDLELLARFLLLRELLRRPRRANAVETLGFAQLRFPALELVSDGKTPSDWKRSGGDANSWRDYLYFLIDAVLRANFALRISPGDVRWLLPRKTFPVNVVGPRDEKDTQADVAWPRARTGSVKSNAILALEAAFRLDSASGEDRATMNELLAAAWDQLRPLLEGPGSTYALDLSKAVLTPVQTGWLCPVTRRVLPRLLVGRTPYGLRGNPPGYVDAPLKLTFPSLPITFPSSAADRNVLEDFILADPDVLTLRELGVWTNLHDRAASFAPYIRAEEHSAQQPPYRLRQFEAEFKRGEINLLACSTTMEMGVDIGSIEAVINTNVPPSIANYRQRVGRAGRRGQSFAASLTFARNTQLDRETFVEPTEYLKRQLRSPAVNLDSRRIVQRHVNALLLARWIGEEAGDLLRLKTGIFYGRPSSLTLPEENAPLSRFLEWLERPTSQRALNIALTQLLVGTPLEINQAVFETAHEMFAAAETQFADQWKMLREQAASLDTDARKAIEVQLNRMCREPLLNELSTHSVLPGHGFPNAVVPLITDCKGNHRKSEQTSDGGEISRNRRYDYPSRNAAVAIREYAPGADVVIDGLVWQSAGVTLNWLRPAHADGPPEIQSIRWFWQCPDCGQADCAHHRPSSCSACGSTGIECQHFLQPAGFRVDWTTQPHAKADQVTFIPPTPSRVCARDARWTSLFDPALGRGRASSSGLVFHSSRGRSRRGYNVCLECGRAAEADDAPLHDHTALMPRKGGGGRCSGNDRKFSITDPLAFGYEVLTDVVEIQPAGLDDVGTAWALASALREALSRQLGIETREMGLSVAPLKGALGDSTHSIFLFDQNAGGAGYAPRLFDNLAQSLHDAEQILDCPARCERGCSACILAADIFAEQAIINRQAALAFVQGLLEGMAAPSPADITGPDCALSPPVADVLIRRCMTKTPIAIWVDPDIDITALQEAPLALVFAKAESMGVTVSLVLRPGALGQMDEAARIGLRNASIRRAFRICTGQAAAAPNGAALLATIETGGRILGFYSRDERAAMPGAGWGAGTTSPIVTSPLAQMPELTPVPPESLERASKPGDHVVILESFPARPMRLFASAFVQNQIEPALKATGLWQPGRLAALSYSDRYVKAPLPAALALSTLAILSTKLAARGASIPVTLTTEPLKSDGYGAPPAKLNHNWPTEASRAGLIEALARELGLSLKADFAKAPHGRKMTVTYQDGSAAIILLDQGFGCWRIGPPDRHDFRKPAAQQAKDILAASSTVFAAGESYIAIKRDPGPSGR